MNQKEAGQLLDKYLQGKANQQEETIVQSWLIHQTTSNYPEETEIEYPLSPEMWNAVRHAINQRKIHLWPRISIAVAVAAIIISAGTWFLKNTEKEPVIQHVAYANDIAPGKQGATLTLANGEKIIINDVVAGTIANQSGVKIAKGTDGRIIYELTGSKSGKLEYNTLSTTKGEQAQVRLPDGSVVFLNAASSLKYPTSFDKLNKRQVSLSGEGYFEVSRDKAHPFIVQSSGQQVEVLGTHFNVNAYIDEPLKTTLLEGSVKISSGNLKKILTPGFEAVNTGNDISLNKVDTELAVAWKNNNIVFANERIETVMKMVERWYDVEVVYQGPMPEDRFRGSVSRFDHVSSVLNVLESTGLLHFKIKDRRIYVSK